MLHNCPECSRKEAQLLRLLEIYKLGLTALMSTYRVKFLELEQEFCHILDSNTNQYYESLEEITQNNITTNEEYKILLAKFQEIKDQLEFLITNLLHPQ